jgi:hypothetical protein
MWENIRARYILIKIVIDFLYSIRRIGIEMNAKSKKSPIVYGKKPVTLKFKFGNAKLSDATATFSLPAGYSCPFAKLCLSKANRKTGRIKDGNETEFRCFAASQESLFPSVRMSRWNNFEKLREASTVEGMANLIQSSLPNGATLIRVHVSGDFFNESYFLAWLNVALNNPRIIFYGYTKAVKYLVEYAKVIPGNFRFTASFGGTDDALIEKHGLKYAKVVYSVEEAERLGLEIDHDDSHASFGEDSFGLLLHGTQPVNTPANEALKKLRKLGLGSYNETKKQERTFKPVTILVAKIDGQINVKKELQWIPTKSKKLSVSLNAPMLS